jgi:hypothetical protein
VFPVHLSARAGHDVLGFDRDAMSFTPRETSSAANVRLARALRHDPIAVYREELIQMIVKADYDRVKTGVIRC